eukprot:TRINITY_DN5116_c0_g1_i1.p1 TRINITY_DN5116_c0_g1~~TRINITY_DN5116_c0_g1_i1.p1  ORF type:complete len:226 (-),score=40.91 TRINITY_DN5116_c0_g1_i1:81-716(-)
MVKVNNSVLLLVAVAALISLVASSNPPRPNLPPNWSAYYEVQNSTNGMPLFSAQIFVGDPNTVRVNNKDLIYILHFDKGFGYVLNATSSSDDSIMCSTMNIVQNTGGQTLDFSNATFVSTNFYDGTSQDLWTGVTIKDTRGIFPVDAYVDSFTSAPYLVRYTNGFDIELVFFDYVPTPPPGGNLFNLPPTLQSLCPPNPSEDSEVLQSLFF